jgi:hypothetical protein
MPDLQHFLARLYVDGALRARFIAEPFAIAMSEGFSADEARELAKISAEDLELAARGFARKRER